MAFRCTLTAAFPTPPSAEYLLPGTVFVDNDDDTMIRVDDGYVRVPGFDYFSVEDLSDPRVKEVLGYLIVKV